MITVSVFDEKQGKRKTVGAVIDGVYVKIVGRSKHFLRNYRGYAINQDIVKALKENKIEKIRIEETDGDTFNITLSSFVENGITFNYGYGNQIVCPEKFWRKEDKNQMELI